MKRNIFAAFAACILLVSACGLPVYTGTGATDNSSSGSETAEISTVATSTVDTDAASSSGSESGEMSVDTAADMDLDFADELELSKGMMHCCYKWKDKCVCYSTLDGDCRPCSISN